MLLQISIGTMVILTTIVVTALVFWFIEGTVTRASPWLIRRPYSPKMAVVLLVTVVTVLIMMTLAVWTWALTFLVIGVFGDLEASVYFSIVAFTTLGFGDVLLPHEWRILGGLTAANGLLNMGLYTALLVEVLRRVRSEQVKGTTDDP